MFSRIKKKLRQQANRSLRPHGLELVHRRLESSPLEQLLLALGHFSIDLIIDVGANSGQYARELLEHGYDGEIASIEPLPEAHSALCEAAESNPRWSVLDRMAIGDRDDTVELQIAGNSLSSSVLTMLPLHEQAAPGSSSIGRVRVPLRRLDDVASDRIVAANAVLLKVDTQGYEYPVLLGAEHCLEKVKLVQLELSLQPLYEGQKLWLELVGELGRRGFTLWSIQPEFCDPRTGQLLQVNGLFAKL